MGKSDLLKRISELENEIKNLNQVISSQTYEYQSDKNKNTSKDFLNIVRAEKNTIDSSTYSILIIYNKKIHYANPQLVKTSGYKLEELIEKPLINFVAKSEQKKVDDIFSNRILTTSKFNNFESKAIFKDGTILDVEVSVNGVLFEKKVGYQVNLRDISKRKLVEKNYKEIIEFAPIGFYKNTKKGKIMMANNVLAKILGFKNGNELIGKNLSDFYYSIEEREKLITKYNKTHHVQMENVEVKFKNKDGFPIWVLMTARAIKNNKQQTIQYDGFIIDISARKKQEEIQKLLLNISKNSYLDFSLKQYLSLTHKELKNIIKATNMYVALYHKDTDNYSFPYHMDEFEDYSSEDKFELKNSLTDLVRRTKKSYFVNQEIEKELQKKNHIILKGKPSPIWMGAPLMATSTNEAIGVIAIQDYQNENAFTRADLHSLEIIASNAGLFIERINNHQELQKAKIEAEEREERFKALFYENSSAMMIIEPTTGKIINTNNAAIDFYGYERHQLENMFIFDIITLPATQTMEEMSLALKNNKKFFNFKHKLADGSIRDVEVYSGKVILKGKPFLYSTIHDVTERRQAEEKILKLSTSIEQSPLSVVITDLEGRIEYANSYFSDLTGYKSSELIGQNPRVLKSGTHNNAFYKNLWSTIKSGHKWQGEICNKKKNGDLFWEKATISPIINNVGQITHFVGIKEDITDIREISQKLKFLADALEQVSECVSITNMEDIIIYVNNSFCNTYGYSKEELVGRHISFLYPKTIEQDQGKKVLTATISGGWKGEHINQRKDGTTFPILLSSAVIEDEIKNKIAMIGIAMDISEIKKSRSELIAAKNKAEESDRLKSAFLMNMSHEIRTPMNGILGFTNLLLEPDLSDENKEEFIHIIQKSGKRLLNTVNDIIEISKIEAGIEELKKSKFNLNDSILNLIKFFTTQANEKNIELVFKNRYLNQEIILESDFTKFESILTNLIRNAIKYSIKGKIQVSYKLQKEHILFCIEDKGIGIPKGRIEAIFNRFEQADIGDTKAQEGSGLGLSITKSYVEMMGGEIWVKSEEKKGSTFYFTIPNTSEDLPCTLEAEETPDMQLNNSMNDLNVLIVEDEEISAYYLSEILKNEVKMIYHVSSGKEAIEFCRNHPEFDLILMDIKLPDINGLEATKTIRTFNNTVIIIAQTAFATQKDKEIALNVGCNDYILKPIIREYLMEVITRNL